MDVVTRRIFTTPTEPRSPRTGHCQITVSTRPISWTSGGDGDGIPDGGQRDGLHAYADYDTPVKRKGGCLISPRR